jgi:hypothetical protein
VGYSLVAEVRQDAILGKTLRVLGAIPISPRLLASSHASSASFSLLSDRALCEPAVDRSEPFAGLISLATAAHAHTASRGTQTPPASAAGAALGTLTGRRHPVVLVTALRHRHEIGFLRAVGQLKLHVRLAPAQHNGRDPPPHRAKFGWSSQLVF